LLSLAPGPGNIRIIPTLQNDLPPNPDRPDQNAYKSFADGTVSDLILTDVFHHLKYPGTALKEFARVLHKRGRVIMLEPYMSALGLLVYGIPHHEPIAVSKTIEWEAPEDWSPENIDYYAAQGNATRIFVGQKFRSKLAGWQKVETIPRSAYAYQAVFPIRYITSCYCRQETGKSIRSILASATTFSH
jgi:hypothetical protein